MSGSTRHQRARRTTEYVEHPDGERGGSVVGTRTDANGTVAAERQAKTTYWSYDW